MVMWPKIDQHITCMWHSMNQFQWHFYFQADSEKDNLEIVFYLDSNSDESNFSGIRTLRELKELSIYLILLYTILSSLSFVSRV